MSSSAHETDGDERRSRRWLRVGVHVATVLGLLVTMASLSDAATCQRIGVPTYFVPGPMWDQVNAAGPAVRYVVLNPASGPGVQPDPGYKATVRRARRAGAEVLGYVDTEYGLRPFDVVKAEIDQYDRWYGVDGIFVDRTSAGLADLPYYQRVSRYVRRDVGGTLALNPGAHADEAYVKLADVVVTFEGDADAYLQNSVPSWVGKYPASRFWHLIYSTSETQLSEVLALSRSQRAGVVYVTDRALPNPWDMPASYWQAEVKAAGQGGRGQQGRR